MAGSAHRSSHRRTARRRSGQQENWTAADPLWAPRTVDSGPTQDSPERLEYSHQELSRQERSKHLEHRELQDLDYRMVMLEAALPFQVRRAPRRFFFRGF